MRGCLERRREARRDCVRRRGPKVFVKKVWTRVSSVTVVRLSVSWEAMIPARLAISENDHRVVDLYRQC